MKNKQILILILGLVLVFSGLYYLTLNKEIANTDSQNNITPIAGENNENQEINQGEVKENKNENKVEGKIVLDSNNKKASCEDYGGVWVDSKNICEINSYPENQCIEKGGEFNPCDSACRHNEKAELCTLQCVLTCTFR